METQEHLIRRLRELYSQAVLTGERVADKYLLLVVETEQSTEAPIAEARLAALYSALRYALIRGESIVTVPPRRAIALVSTDEPRLSDSLARLRSELKIATAKSRLPRTRCWRQRLPGDPVELTLTVLEVAG